MHDDSIDLDLPSKLRTVDLTFWLCFIHYINDQWVSRDCDLCTSKRTGSIQLSMDKQ